MEMTNINIQNEANIGAKGEHNNGNCDPCIILETGETFTSQIDLAKHLDVSVSAVSATICGRQQTCKGYHIISMSRLPEGVDLILSRLREASALEEAGKKWFAQEAEAEAKRKEEEARLEAERKAAEKFEEDKQNIIDKINRRHNVCGRIAASMTTATERLIAAKNEYFELTGECYDDSVVT
jgi:hypothetical protein